MFIDCQPGQPYDNFFSLFTFSLVSISLINVFNCSLIFAFKSSFIMVCVDWWLKISHGIISVGLFFLKSRWRKCKKCNRDIFWNGSTTTMIRHLKLVHSVVKKESTDESAGSDRDECSQPLKKKFKQSELLLPKKRNWCWTTICGTCFELWNFR